MIVSCYLKNFIFKMEFYYFLIIEMYVYNHNVFYIHAFLHKDAIAIASKSGYFINMNVKRQLTFFYFLITMRNRHVFPFYICAF